MPPARAGQRGRNPNDRATLALSAALCLRDTYDPALHQERPSGIRPRAKTYPTWANTSRAAFHPGSGEGSGGSRTESRREPAAAGAAGAATAHQGPDYSKCPVWEIALWCCHGARSESRDPCRAAAPPQLPRGVRADADAPP
ncbi:hypothetical protein GCM10014715_08030 [Streptomyces spiralis]|uniref:Uncharacterized protein n=1 Tax=Streptomyces spiralis TaxID=66376 RepID=A0A918ZLE9_9ACTN|nr:hypothetical protein GCM10014715_08030 [Streptomyces spiralis]